MNYYNDITYNIADPTLQSWQDQGVFLTNCSLTLTEYTPEGEPNLYMQNSHSYLWRVVLMEKLFTELSDIGNLIFVFMGTKARYYEKFIDLDKNNVVLTTIHPVADYRNGSQLFIGSKIFNKINDELTKKHKNVIEW